MTLQEIIFEEIRKLHAEITGSAANGCVAAITKQLEEQTLIMQNGHLLFLAGTKSKAIEFLLVNEVGRTEYEWTRAGVSLHNFRDGHPTRTIISEEEIDEVWNTSEFIEREEEK